MVRKTFGIYSNPLEHCNLFIETGSDYIACWCKDSATNVVKAFELFSFPQEHKRIFRYPRCNTHFQNW